MATFYWVGGNGNWDSFTPTNWAATSGGAGGAGVPTSADSVIFDSASGATNFVVNVDVGAACLNFTVGITTVGRITFAAYLSGNPNYIAVYGAVSITSQTTIDTSLPVGLDLLALSGAISVSTNNTKLYALRFGSAGASTATWTIGSGITANALILYSGTLNTNGQTVTLTNQYHNVVIADSGFSVSGSDAKTLTLGASAINIGTSANEYSGIGASLNLESGTGLTFNANTSTITIGSTSAVNTNNSYLYGGGFTFRTVVMNGVESTITSANTFTNGFTKNAVSNLSFLKVYANQIVSGGTFQLAGAAASRLIVLSDICRVQRVFTLTGTAARTLSYVSFADISLSFSSSVGGTSIGDLLNNSGITFTPPVTRYLVLGGATKSFSSTTAWSATSGGATGATAPLPQDSVIFNAASGAGQLDVDSFYFGTGIATSGFAAAINFISAEQYILGQPNDAAGVFNGAGTAIIFRFSSSIALPSLPDTVVIDGGSATATMSANQTIAIGQISVLSGNFDTSSYSLSASSIVGFGSGSGIRQVNDTTIGKTYSFGSSIITLSSAAPLYFYSLDTVNAGTSTIEFTSTSIAGIIPVLANKTLHNLKLTPGSAAAIYAGLSGATFNNITLSPHTSLVKINFIAGTTTTIGSMSINGTKGAGVIIGANITSTSAVSSNAVLAIGSNIVTEYVAFLGITKSGASTLSARGAADLGANVGISFQQHSVIAFSGAGLASFSVPGNFAGSSYLLVVGAGGGAGKRNTPSVAAGGGGGGAIALASNLNISAGQTIYLNSPTGGAGATSSGAGGSPVNAWANIAANSQPTLVTDGAYADSGSGSPGVSSSSGGGGGLTGSSLGQLEFTGATGGAGSAGGGGGGACANLIFRTGKAGGSGSASGGGGGGGSIQSAGIAGSSTTGGNGGAVTPNSGGIGGAGGASPVVGGTGIAGSSVGGGGGGGSNTASVNSAAGGAGATGSQWTYNSLNGIAGSGLIGYGGAGGAGGGISNTSLTNSAGGAGGNGVFGSGGGGGGRGSISGGATGNGGAGGDSLVLFVYVEARGGNFATIIG